jgi:hypothetical protein
MLTAVCCYGKVNCPTYKIGDLTIDPSDGVGWGGGLSKFNVSVAFCELRLQSDETLGEVMPDDKVWPSEKYPAPVFETKSDVSIGGLIVPAGRYSLYFVPSHDAWKLILNKQVRQTAGSRDETQDLGTVVMSKAPAPADPEEEIQILFLSSPHFRKGYPNELHFKWGYVDVYAALNPWNNAEAGDTQSAPHSESPTAH